MKKSTMRASNRILGPNSVSGPGAWFVVCAAIAMMSFACRSTEESDPEVLRDRAEAQIERGRKAYVASCAECHGPALAGTHRAPALVGEGSLPLEPPAGSGRRNPFLSAADVADYVVEYMPPNGDLLESDTEYWAILAYMMHFGGYESGVPLGPGNANEALLTRR